MANAGKRATTWRDEAQASTAEAIRAMLGRIRSTQGTGMRIPVRIPGDLEDENDDVIGAYSPWCSPSSPDEYVRELGRHYPIGPDTNDQPRPAPAIATTASIRQSRPRSRAIVQAPIRMVDLRVRVVPERAKRIIFRDFVEASLVLATKPAQRIVAQAANP